MNPVLTLKVRVIGQRTRSPGQKTWFQLSFDCLTGHLWGQESQKSRSKVMLVKVDFEGQCQRSRSTGQKMWFQVSFDHLAVRGQRSYGSRSKVTWVKPSLKFIILAEGLTSMSSCFIFLKIWDLKTRRVKRDLAAHSEKSVLWIDCTEDGEILSQGRDGVVNKWKSNDGWKKSGKLLLIAYIFRAWLICQALLVLKWFLKCYFLDHQFSIFSWLDIQ